MFYDLLDIDSLIEGLGHFNKPVTLHFPKILVPAFGVRSQNLEGDLFVRGRQSSLTSWRLNSKLMVVLVQSWDFLNDNRYPQFWRVCNSPSGVSQQEASSSATISKSSTYCRSVTWGNLRWYSHRSTGVGEFLNVCGSRVKDNWPWDSMSISVCLKANSSCSYLYTQMLKRCPSGPRLYRFSLMDLIG